MMTFEQIDAFVKRVTYKPGVKVYVEQELPWRQERGWPHFKLLACMEVPDSRPPHGPETVWREEIVPFEIVRSEAELIRHLHRLFQGMEMHEVDEWFKVDGVAPFYPHSQEQHETRPLPTGPARSDGDAPAVKVPAAPEAGARNDRGREHSSRRRQSLL